MDCGLSRTEGGALEDTYQQLDIERQHIILGTFGSAKAGTQRTAMLISKTLATYGVRHQHSVAQRLISAAENTLV